MRGVDSSELKSLENAQSRVVERPTSAQAAISSEVRATVALLNGLIGLSARFNYEASTATNGLSEVLKHAEVSASWAKTRPF